MTRFFLKIYDYLAQHRPLAFALMLCILGGCIVSSLQLGYKENAAEFLPQNPDNERYMSVYNDLGGQGTITLIFHTDGTDDCHYEILDAIGTFEEAWDQTSEDDDTEIPTRFKVDEDAVFDAMNYLRQHIGCFLTEEDYARIDSLLSDDSYITTSLTNVKRMLSFPMGALAQEAVTADPLNLFSPALQRLAGLSASESYEVDEEVLFDTAGNALAFIESPWGGSDTRNNARLAARIASLIDHTMEAHPSVKITAVGAPLIAVTNAQQIKRDSILSILLSVALIAAILLFAIRKKRNILLLGLSVLAGWLFALALIALFKPTISIIVIGIGSVLVGIAVNYPLHFIDHLGECGDRRETLKEMVEPLVTGNITTVSAFACLVFVKAEAMRDLGLFGALMLVGTILFVMIFLPLMAKAGAKKIADVGTTDAMETVTSASDYRHQRLAAWALLPVIAATVVFGILSTRTAFDSDLHNINYMTPQQQADLELLSHSMGDTATSIEYYVSEAPTLDEALSANLAIRQPALRQYRLSGVQGIVPSTAQQAQNIEGWNAFVTRHPNLGKQLSATAARLGFTPNAFAAFTAQLSASYTPQDPATMTPLLALTSNYISRTDEGYRVVSLLTLPKSQSAQAKAEMRANLSDSRSFVFDIEDVGMNLVESLNTDFNYILYVCSFVVFFFLWLSFGRLELAILSFLPMAVGWLWILGIMDIAAVKFNIVNIILATFIFGQGDDYTIFITEGLIYEHANGHRRLKSYRRSVILSSLLMFVGIGTLIFAKHPAMRSLAVVTIIGMSTVVIMACYLPPVIFRWLVSRKGEKRQMPITLARIGKTVWILLVFFLAAFVFVTPYTLFYRLIGKDSEQKRLRYHRLIQRFSSIAVRHLPGVEFTEQNTAGEDYTKPAVIVANHQSHLDLLCALQLNPKLVILTNDWVWRNPVYGLIIRYAEFYPVSDGYERILPRLQSLVSRGYSVMVFPEGTRSTDGTIGRFHKGAFQLAQQLGVDLLPVLIHGAEHVMPKNDIFLRKGKLTVEILPRIPAATFIGKDTKTLASETRQFFVEQKSRLQSTLEDEQYWLPFVQAQYLYKGREVERRAKAAFTHYLSTGEYENGQGEIPLLKALAHPEQQFSFAFDNADDYLIAAHCALMPINLIYTLNAPVTSTTDSTTVSKPSTFVIPENPPLQ